MKRRGMSFQVAAGPAEDDLSSRGGISGWRPDLISAKWDTPARVNILIYNSKDLLIKTLQSGRQPAGGCQITWDGTNNTGKSLPVGIYFIVLRVNGKETESLRIIKK